MPRARLVDVADLAGVSVKTVSNVVNAHPKVREGTRSRVEAAIGELGYRPHAVGRLLRRGRTDLVALAVPEIDAPYFADLARHVVEVAGASGLVVLVEQTGGALEAERALIDAREAGLVDGLILSPVAISAAELEARRAEVPMVLLGEGARPAGIDHVGLDDAAAAREATEHLLTGGRRCVAYLGAQQSGPVATARRRQGGWAGALAGAGLQPVPELQLAVPDFSPASGARAVAAALAAGTAVDALVCASDLLALGALRALHAAGLDVPGDVAVVGWDDIAIAAWLTPTLSTIRSDRRQVAESAVGMLAERVGGAEGAGRRVVARHELVVRGSSGPPR